MLSALVAAALIVLLTLNWSRPEEKFLVPAAGRTAGDRRVILLVVDRLSYSEIKSGAGSVLRSLSQSGLSSLMNVRSGRSNSESAYLSLGSGARAVAGSEGGRAFSRSEIVEGDLAETIFQRYTGRRPAGEVFHPYADALRESNQALPYPVAVGLLGQLLAGAGIKAAVVGHADTEDSGRSAAMIAMDSMGQVALGEAGLAVVVEEPLFPYGKRTDIKQFTAVVASYLREAHLVVADFGDFSRLDEYWPRLSSQRRGEMFAAAMAGLDRVLEGLIPLLDENHILLMVTPSPPMLRPGGGEQLTFFLAVWPGGPGQALLNSPTTRRQGLIANTDLSAMVYSFLTEGVLMAPSGRVMGVTTSPERTMFLDGFAAHSQWIFQLRPPVVRGFVLLLIIVLLAVLVGLIFRMTGVKRLFFIMEGLMVTPLALLLLPALTRVTLSYMHTAVLIIAVSMIITLALYPLKRKGLPWFWSAIGLTTATALIIDTITGAGLQQRSILGYDAIGGSRYYGIGNEYMGVLIGSLILSTVTMAGIAALPSGVIRETKVPGAGRFARFTPLHPAILLIYLATIFIMASPRFGANLGGALSAAVAFGTAWSGLAGFLEKGRVFSLLTTVTLFVAFALGLLWALNLAHPSVLPSHLGDFGEMVRHRGLEGFLETAFRKINMNLRLIRYSIWSRAFVALLGLQTVLFFYPAGFMKRLKKEQPHLVYGAAAAVAGSVTALLTNDSGVVAAALVLLYAALPVLMTIVGKLPAEQ
jgi:hypothetical protein